MSAITYFLGVVLGGFVGFQIARYIQLGKDDD